MTLLAAPRHIPPRDVLPVRVAQPVVALPVPLAQMMETNFVQAGVMVLFLRGWTPDDARDAARELLRRAGA